MIVKKYWRKYTKNYTGHSEWKGWFLFGFIPLYVEQILY